MTKHLFRGAAAVALFSMLCAAMTPAPLFAASSNLGAQMEQTTNPGDNGQDDNSQNGQSNQSGQNNQNQQGQNQQQNQGQSGQGQQQGNNQGACFASTDQANANFPTGCTTTLGPGARQWYQFRYQGLSADRNDEDNDSSDSSSQPPTVDARLQMDTPGCISFEVTTQAHLQNPDPDDDGINEPIGAGTPVVVQNNNSSDDSGNDSSDDSSSNSNNDNNNNDDRDDSVLGWQGSANANITFYIIVRNTRDFSCTYNLSLTGAGVPVPGQQQNQQQGQFGQQGQGQQQGQPNQQGDQNNSGQDNNGQENSDQNSQNDGQNNNDQNNSGTNG